MPRSIVTAAARIHGIDEKRVREGKKQKEELESLLAKRKWLDGAGRKTALPDVGTLLTLWIQGVRAENLPRIVAALK